MQSCDAVLRSCLEYAGYAVYISRNPELGRAWLNRHQDEQTLRQVRQEFTIGKVREAIAAANRHAADRFGRLYDQFIDSAHTPMSAPPRPT